MDPVHLGCTQREAVNHKDLTQSKSELFTKIPNCDTEKVTSGRYDMKGHAENILEFFNAGAQVYGTTSQGCHTLHRRSSTLQDDFESVVEVAKVCPQIILKCLCWSLDCAYGGVKPARGSLREPCTGEPIPMVMTASSYRSPPGTTVGVAGRRDSRTSSLTHVAILAQVREENISLTTILSW